MDDLIENYQERIALLHQLSTFLFLSSTIHSKEKGFLKEYINIETGSMNLDENDPDGQYPFFTRNIDTFYSNKFTHEGKGVIVAGEGNFNPKFVNGRFALHQRAYFISSKTGVLTAEVIYEIILSNKIFLDSVAVGSTVKSLRRFCFEKMPFFKDADYEFLGEKLVPIFEEITQLKKRIAILRSQKAILLKKYF